MVGILVAGCFGLAGVFVFAGCTVCALIIAAVGIALLLTGRRSTKKVDPKGKAVFITGCDSGFGNSLCRRLDKLGFVVFAGCLFSEKEGAKKLKAESSEKLHIVQIDVTDDWQVRGAVKYVKENIGDNVLWAVVNNAGIAIFTEIEWCSVQQFQRIMDVNAFGVVRVTKAFLPLVRNVNGRIINVASLAGRFTFPAFAAYSMSKVSCIAFSDALRREMSKFNVNVVTIEPGLYKTAISETKHLEDFNRKSWSETPTEIKEAYGEEYFDAFIGNIGHQMQRARSNVSEVVDLMETAVLDETPLIRYVPASSIVRATILASLPSGIVDKVLSNTLPKFKSPSESSSKTRSSVSVSSAAESDNGDSQDHAQDHGDVFKD